jgi:NhaA family Na+:H+ antiporter
MGLIVANSPIGSAFLDFKHSYLGPESIGLKLSVEHWVSDLLLAIFFLVAGLELKYELRLGALSKVKTALVPVLGGIGGVVIPAAIYLSLTWGTELVTGWPIPTATDIAFALGILAIFGSGMPKSARVFLLALAIFDDLVAITIIAIFYTTDVRVEWLLVSVLVASMHIIAERVKRLPINLIRVVTFILLWYAVYQSGVHATIAGVVLGLIIPASKSHSLTAKLQPYTNTFALPIFAFFAVGIALPQFESEISPVFPAIAIALPVGKIVGITVLAYLANKLASESDRLNLKFIDFAAVAAIAGVGFTVSLLMTKLSFEQMPEVLAEATLAVILGSLTSMAIGGLLASWRGRHYKREARSVKLAERSDS